MSDLGKWILQTFYSVLTPSGVVESVVVLTEDVSEKRRVMDFESKLKKTARKYHTLVENLPVAAYTTDSAGIVISANPAMVKMFLADSKEEIYTIPVSQRYRDPDDREHFLTELREKGKVDNYEMQLIRGDGSPFWASVSANVTLNELDEIQFIDGIIRDISSVKALEAEIVKAQKLESIGILAGGIAHDFNNIMAAVLGNISLAKLYSSDNSKVQSKLEEAEKASLRASELTRQLLTFSKGGQPVRRVSSIHKILKESAAFASIGSEVKVIFDLSEDLWSVEVDEAQIGQAVNNMVINAIHAMPGGGEIKIGAANHLFDFENDLSIKPGQYLRVSILDRGSGISPDILDNIFDPYFTTKPKGSGLGLATVYSIIRNHGGRILVDSSSDKGTEFVFYLPAVERKPEEFMQPATSGGKNGYAKILVMDDEVSVLEVVSEILEHHGYQVDTVTDGLEAVKKYRTAFDTKEAYDLLIMDITVPGGIGGVEALRQILTIDSTAKAIVASGYANNTVMANYQEFGFVDSMIKPFRLETLLEAVYRIVSVAPH